MTSVLNTYQGRHPIPEARRCSSSTVVKVPVRLTRNEANTRYGRKDIGGVVPTRYLSWTSGLNMIDATGLWWFYEDGNAPVHRCLAGRSGYR